jgi:hypothetical protein
MALSRSWRQPLKEPGFGHRQSRDKRIGANGADARRQRLVHEWSDASVPKSRHRLCTAAVFELLSKRDEIEQRAFRLHVDQQLEIALRPLIATRDRTEQANVSSSVSCCDVSDLVSFVLDIHGLFR